MKRIFAILLAFIMILSVLSGCNKSQNDDNSQNSDISQNSGTSSSAVDSQVDESSQQQENSQDEDNSQDDNASQNPSETENSHDSETFKLSIIGDYADNIVSELKGRYAAGERVAMELQTITEHYYEVTVNGTQIPQADSDLEYTWFIFNMPKKDTIVSITQKGVSIPPLPADSDNITFQCGDILAQIVLDDAQKETVQGLLADKHDWIDQMPEIVVNCYFTGFAVKAGYCINSGMLIDYIGERSRQLTTEEKGWIENLISLYSEDLGTNNATEFSYADELAMFPEGTPGAKHAGFKNTTELPVHNEAEAIEQAKNECTIEWNNTQVYYDTAKDIWKVTFYTKGVPGCDQSVYLDANGITLMIVYGE